ncbi:hypothetical protein AHF37_08648 [Paragonimus kellicotti]|nr:hypothetical protein AHF37_08648 [Paragonimus kellicotti]
MLILGSLCSLSPGGSFYSSNLLSSIASTRSSNRVVRSRCKKIPGDWCTHYECATFGSTRRLTTTTASSLQRNTNNTTDTTYSLNVTEPEVSSVGRQRRSRRTHRGNVNLTQTADQSVVNHTIESADRSDRVASTSSTYVYTYVPAGETMGGADVIVSEPNPSRENGDGPELNEGFWQRRFAHRSSDKDTQASASQFNHTTIDQSSNNTTSRGWLTRHIFGLEQTDSAESPSSQFISSDAEDADTMISSRSHSRRKVGSTVGHSATIRTGVARKSQGLFGRILDYGVRVLRRLLSIILTVLLSILYTGYALLSGAVYLTTSADADCIIKAVHLW